VIKAFDVNIWTMVFPGKLTFSASETGCRAVLQGFCLSGLNGMKKQPTALNSFNSLAHCQVFQRLDHPGSLTFKKYFLTDKPQKKSKTHPAPTLL
jgi:hypothetical protein